MTTWEICSAVHVAGGYEEGEATHNGVPADWVASVSGARLTKKIYMDIQFSSIGVTRSEAERIVQAVLDGLNERHGMLA